jgi:hypothetical protein
MSCVTPRPTRSARGYCVSSSDRYTYMKDSMLSDLSTGLGDEIATIAGLFCTCHFQCKGVHCGDDIPWNLRIPDAPQFP